MVGLVLVSHSRPLAQAVGDLLRRLVDANLQLTCCGGVGEDRAELGTDAIEIQEAIGSVYSEDGVLVLMDMGSAILSAETALEFLNPEQQGKVRLTSAPLVEGGMAAAVQAQLGASLVSVANAALASLLPKQDQVQDVSTGAPAAYPAPALAQSEILEINIRNPHGLHLRPATVLIKTLSGFPGEVLIENRTANRGPVLAQSLVDVARLQIREGDLVRFSISSPDPKPVIESIRSLVENQFGELAQPVPPSEAVVDLNVSEPFSVSRGIAIGRPILLDTIVHSLPTYAVESAPEVKREVEKLGSAIAEAIAEFDRRIERLKGSLDRPEEEIFDAQRMIFADPTILKEVQKQIQEHHLNAAAAWHKTLSGYATDQENAEDPYLRARAADFREVERTVLSRLIGGGTGSALPDQPFAEPTLLICEELTPTLAEQSRRLSIAGVIQLGGGITSHGAILARALGLPAIGGARKSRERLLSAQQVAINGSKGSLWIDPPPDVLAELAGRQQIELSEGQAALLKSQERAMTRDGIPIQVGGNAGSADDILSARTNGADFIGLFRSEFLFQDLHHEPDEHQQLTAYRRALEPAADVSPVTVRLLDVGGDKPLEFLPQAKEANPFLGVRGIRLLRANPRFFRVHLRALLRLAHFFRIQLLIPMITEVSEILAVRELLTELDGDLTKANVPHRWPVPLGAMIETPSAALMIDQLLPHLDFVSIGTNDLTQYILCAERGSAQLMAFSDSLHPAVLRMCEAVIRTAQERGVKASICGEIASDPEALPILLGLGHRDFSVTAGAIPAMKAMIRKVNLSGIASQLASKQPFFEEASDVRKFSRDLFERSEN
ncbi:MAG: phosphoenolpyruvate--protein phosphotransferase [Verrucomicrobia bacterium]|nr:phosphoenolpyruvate--protein phosphotransferase [Verrucomicrobiota bacterium]